MSTGPVLVDVNSLKDNRWIIFLWDAQQEDFVKTFAQALTSRFVVCYYGLEQLSALPFLGATPAERIQMVAQLGEHLDSWPKRIYTVGDQLLKMAVWFEKLYSRSLFPGHQLLDVVEIVHDRRPITWEERSSFKSYLDILRSFYDLPKTSEIETFKAVCQKL